MLWHPKPQASKCQKTYRAWLQGAQEKGMAPLFKAIRKGEATTARPYRDLSAEAEGPSQGQRLAAHMERVSQTTGCSSLSHVEQQAPRGAQTPSSPASCLPSLLSRRSSCGSSSLKAELLHLAQMDGTKLFSKNSPSPCLKMLHNFTMPLKKVSRFPNNSLLPRSACCLKSPTAERPIS